MTDPRRWRLGLGGSDHDFSAALMRGGDIRVAIEQERLTRVKNGLAVWYREPLSSAVDYCLRAEGIVLDDVAAVAASDTIPARTRAAFRGRGMRLFPHHLCHAAAAYMMLPEGCRAAIVVLDGYGSIVGEPTGDRARRETISFHVFSDEPPQCLGATCGESHREQDDFPTGVSNSVGMLYEAVTQIIGYGAMDAGKTMGLAAHGRPRHFSELMEFVTFGGEPSDCFRCPTEASEVVDRMDAILTRGGGGFQVKADLAASVQEIVHRVLEHAVSLVSTRDVDVIAISGGCGLNTVANARLAATSPKGLPVSIPPHCGDAGLGLGALWLLAREEGGRTPHLSFRGAPLAPALARPGRLYAREEVEEAVNAAYPRLARDPAVASAHDVADKLAAGDVIGILNGRSEIGPRALGGRSILADPRSVAVRERINRVLKGREPFRPLAPVVLTDDFDQWFEDARQADPYMMKVAKATERCRREAPAVLHVDGTARVQVVGRNGDPWLIEILEAFRDRTGVAVLVNTSFNRRGEPIVETPADAVDAFLGLGLDGLWLDGLFYRSAR